jgi:hypothetical protein
MAKSNQSNGRTSPVNIAPPESAGIMAAWQGLYHAFGARLGGYDIVDDGIVLTDVTFDAGTNVETLVRDVNTKNRRVSLFPTILYLNGQAPESFTTAQEMTVFAVQNWRGSAEDGSTRTPKYVRDAFARLKASQGIASKRGPKPRSINLKNLGSLDASVLRNANVPASELEHLIAVAQEVVATQAAAEVTNA